MRELRFRAWHEKLGRMFDDVCVDSNGTELLDDTGKAWWIGHEHIMQFTGLLDKNGREIYEGDILGRESYTNWVVGWKAPSFIIYNITNPDSQYTIWNIDIEEREVIGNIYENEDLLRNVTECLDKENAQ